ncbi:polysaccharide deacetylase [Primorskyibacter flagellatus]|uniref:Chitooligosaccharide deacetylase n=1 Tax=Primorskyibacter flagellatus TaxID=1387277 RepID=A0A916ZW17_9RHOB|nr:polysaccharide deacetylase [Primorskyibacter flagellatus]GGE15481.1 polysaccharide deacetylase [Primorskyibacter flagellatus]
MLTLIDNPVPWPNGARCAAAFTWDLDGDSLIHIARPRDGDTYVSTTSYLRYGPEVSLPRILKIYAHYGLTQTFFVPGWIVERYPAQIEAILAAGHEIGHHGYLHESYNQQTKDDELYWFERALATYDRIGFRPKGFRAPLNEFSRHTLDHLIGAGIEYDSSLMGDDVPYLLTSRARPGEVLEIPQNMACDDYPQYMHSWDFGIEMPIQPPSKALQLWTEEFEAQYENGGLWLSTWHPFLSARTARAKVMIALIEHMQAKGDVWITTMGAINDHVRACIADGSWAPRRDLLPYDISPIPEFARTMPGQPKG